MTGLAAPEGCCMVHILALGNEVSTFQLAFDIGKFLLGEKVFIIQCAIGMQALLELIGLVFVAYCTIGR
jgi:hypothetical protein